MFSLISITLLGISTLNDGVFRAENFAVKKWKTLEQNDNYVYNLLKGQNSQLYIAYYNGSITKIDQGQEVKIYQSISKGFASLSFFQNEQEVFFVSDGYLQNMKPKNKLKTMVNYCNKFYEFKTRTLFSVVILEQSLNYLKRGKIVSCLKALE